MTRKKIMQWMIFNKNTVEWNQTGKNDNSTSRNTKSPKHMLLLFMSGQVESGA